MAKQAPDRWRYAVARESEQRSAVAGAIGEYLQYQFAGIVIEPLPERMTALVDELRRRRDQRRNGS